MARLRSAAPREVESPDIEAWYREQLAKPARTPWDGSEWTPLMIGPTWRIGADGLWVLPAKTLGWGVLGWCGLWLQHRPAQPWTFTMEQARWLLWWYAVDDQGEFLFRDAVLQRLKGWGKDPLMACLAAVEAFGPVRFDHWDRGVPVGIDVEAAWVQCAAVSKDQTKNTMRLFPALLSAEAKAAYGIQHGKTIVHGLGDTRLIEGVTSSPTTLEGARSTLVEMGETHHWKSSNEGLEMADVIERNQTKSPDGAARSVRHTNAFEPGEGSVAENDRDAYESAQAGTVDDTGLMYDSLEAPPEAPLTAEGAPAVVEMIRGDSTWLHPGRIVKSILDKRNPPSRSRRFWYNQIWAAEDAWITRPEWDALANPGVVIPDGELITLGFDGSKSDDHTALIACSVELAFYWPIHIWVPPEYEGPDGKKITGEISTADVDAVVHRTFDQFDVVGFFGDRHPWESHEDAWAEEFGGQLLVKPSGQHAISWDMAGRQKDTTNIIEALHAGIVEGDMSHDGSSLMAQHFYNGRRYPTSWGISVRKEHRESTRKIDSIPATALAREARRLYLALPESRRRPKKKSGKASFL